MRGVSTNTIAVISCNNPEKEEDRFMQIKEEEEEEEEVVAVVVVVVQEGPIGIVKAIEYWQRSDSLVNKGLSGQSDRTKKLTVALQQKEEEEEEEEEVMD